MKKFNYLFAVAALALASCSSDEIIESTDTSPGSEIAFRATMEATTRAADVTTANLNTFNVTAYPYNSTSTPYMDNVTFTENAGTFTSATKYFWPASTNLDFYAYAPLSAPDNQITRTAYNSFTVTPSTTLTSQADLVFANTNNKGKNNATAGAIALNFRHAESKIVVKLKNSQPNLKFDVQAIKIANVDGSATFTYNKANDSNTDTQNTNEAVSGTTLKIADWTNNTEAEEKIVSYTTSTFSNIIPGPQSTALYLNSASNNPSTTDVDEDLSMILIPQTTTAATAYSSASMNVPVTSGSYIAIKMIIKNNDSSGTYVALPNSDNLNGHTNWAMWPVAFNWEPGKKYIYTIDIGDGGYWEMNSDTNADLDPILENTEIKFVNVTVDEWDNKGVNIPPPATLAELKTLINEGGDGSQMIGYYVDASGNLSMNSNTAIGLVAYVSSTNVDESFDGSRIIVVPANTAYGNNKAWATEGTTYATSATGISNITDESKWNGYANTQGLYTLSSTDFPAAKYAWEFQSKNGTAVVPGGSGWFLPSKLQAGAIWNNSPGLHGIYDGKNQSYTSTELSATDAIRAIYSLGNTGYTGIRKEYSDTNMIVIPCFVY